MFVPNTPLHDGAVIISNNRIVSAACILPLADDKSISKKLGTRHRAAIGMSKESDAIVVVVSEETGKVSIAKDGTLIEDVTDETLKRILLKHVVTDRFGEVSREEKISAFKSRLPKRKVKVKVVNEENDEEHKANN